VVPYDFFRLKRDFFLTAKVKVAGSLKDMGVSKNRGTPKSSILIGFSIINHPFGIPLFFGNTHMMIYFQLLSISLLGPGLSFFSFQVSALQGLKNGWQTDFKNQQTVSHI